MLDKYLECRQSVLSCNVRAQATTRVSTREARIIGQIWSALGVDPNITPDYLTLGEIGIESMFAIELQQGLDRDYNIKVSLSDIKSITVGEIKQFESGKIDQLRQFADDVRQARDRLTKVKFVIPTEQYQRLNDCDSGPDMYVSPKYSTPKAIISKPTFSEMTKVSNRGSSYKDWVSSLGGSSYK